MTRITAVSVQLVQLTDVDNPDWQDLFNKLWPEREGRDALRGHYTYRACDASKVRLSQAGWNQIKRLIVERNICAEVVNSCTGFSCALVLYRDREEPYPGAVIDAKPIFKVCSHVLPGNGRSGFSAGWTEFEPLFTRAENVEKLKQNRLELPKPSYHYDY